MERAAQVDRTAMTCRSDRTAVCARPVSPKLKSMSLVSMNAVGSVAALCTTISFVPQLFRVWQRKSARDISLIMFLLFSFGVACWLVYGIGINRLQSSRPTRSHCCLP